MVKTRIFNPLGAAGTVTVNKKILKSIQIEPWACPNLPMSLERGKKIVTRPF